MSKRTIPFNWLPAAWGLKGKTREIAQAEYELEGFELKKRLLDISKDDLAPIKYAQKLIDLEFEYKLIDKSTQMRRLVTLIENESQRALASLELDYKEGIITDTEYQKQSATLKGEPWVKVVDIGFGGTSSLEGSFELDWNEQFTDELQAKGYVGPTPDSIVNQWFMEVCRNIALEEFDGTGNFTSDSAANLETMKRWNSSESFEGGRRGYS